MGLNREGFEYKWEMMRKPYDGLLAPTDKIGPEHGRASAMIRLSLIGPAGAISWSIITGWYLPVTQEWLVKNHPRSRGSDAMGAGVVIHSPKPLGWQDESYKADECDLLPGKKCWGDVGFIAGEEFFTALLENGEDAVWEKMHEWYEDNLNYGKEDE